MLQTTSARTFIPLQISAKIMETQRFLPQNKYALYLFMTPSDEFLEDWIPAWHI